MIHDMYSLEIMTVIRDCILTGLTQEPEVREVLTQGMVALQKVPTVNESSKLFDKDEGKGLC
jgi:hypothetical protein